MAVFCVSGCGKTPGDSADVTLRISAASSIAYVIERLAGPMSEDLHIQIEVNAGASGVLAKQIEQGQKADLFISADPLWLDRLAQQALIDETNRAVIAQNQLVVVGLHELDHAPATLNELTDKAFHPIAIGDPAYVPAGRYAVQALGVHQVSREAGVTFAEAPNVRAALAYVQSGQCPVGVVYASDAQGAADIVTLIEIDPADHDPIHYEAAAVTDGPGGEAAQRVLAWLQSEPATAALRDAGFTSP